MIEIYKLTKDRKKVRIKQLDLTKFEKIGTTGDGLALKYEKGKNFNDIKRVTFGSNVTIYRFIICTNVEN